MELDLLEAPVAAASNGLPVGGGLVLLGISVVSLAIGVGHYRGWQRAGIQRVPFDSLHFSPAWLGATGLFAAVAGFLARLGPWGSIALAVPAVVTMVITLASLFWLPRFLLPSWYLDWRERGRPADEVAARADLRYAKAKQARRAKRLSRR